MGQIRNTRKIYFLNYNKLRLLLILLYVYLLLCVFNVKFLEHDVRINKNNKSRRQTT
jgi:cell division protein FtsL